MYVKVEPSGCCERKGMVQIRFSMYLDPTDYGYEKHHIQVPVIPEGGYSGKVGEQGQPLDNKDFQKWLSKLPTTWQNNPFHNHFIYVEPTATDAEILAIGKSFLAEAYSKWSNEKQLNLENPNLVFPKNVDASRLAALATKVQHLQNTTLQVKG